MESMGFDDSPQAVIFIKLSLFSAYYMVAKMGAHLA